jgi:hypothetical protein
MGVPVFDDAAWPILQITYAPTMSAYEAEIYYARIASYLARGERFAVLMDARPASVPSAVERARIAQFMEETAPRSSHQVSGLALVVDTFLGRGVLTAVQWLTQPPFPIRAFGGVPEALEWLRASLAPPAPLGEKRSPSVRPRP